MTARTRVKAPLPPHLLQLLDELPANVTRRVGAALITKLLFPVSHRSLERWPLPIRHVNGKAAVPTAELLSQAWAKLNAAPIVMSGCHATAETVEHVAEQ
jgi:hypothetical protein